MIRTLSKSQTALTFGLAVLIGATLASVFGVWRLEDGFEERRRGMVAQDAYDGLSIRVRDLQIAGLAADQNGSAQNKARLANAKAALNQAIQNVETAVQDKPAQRASFAHARRELVLLAESSGNPNAEFVDKVERTIQGLNDTEFANLERHGRSLVASINQQMMISVISLLVAVVLIVFAMRAHRRNERAKSQMIQELGKLKDEAESASMLKSKFLSTVSHEIRTPLNGIIGLSDLVANSPPDTNMQAFARTIHQSGKTLLRIINDILDFSKIEAGRFTLALAECSIVDIADQVLSTLSPKAAEKSLNLTYEIDPSLPRWVKGDADRMSQVLFNLVGNAIKFTSVGGVLLRVKSMGSGAEGVRVLFTVDDTGIGIATSDLAGLFTPFRQLRLGGTAGEPGTGLGLSISQSIVSAMGGQIEARSELGRGSCFSFTLPFREHSTETLERRPQFSMSHELKVQSRIAPLARLGFRPRILVAEDNPTNQIVVQTMLQKLEVDFQTASDGRDALALVEANDFDLILMDFQMPVMDGLEATRELRRRGARIPIVAMTANAYDEDERKCREAGMNGFLSKPLSIEALRHVLETHLPERKTFAKNVLLNLDSAVGSEGRKKVVRAFISTIPIFRESTRKAVAAKSVEEIQRMGHRFKASASSVGGSEFSETCAELERANSWEEIAKLERRASQELEELESILKSFA